MDHTRDMGDLASSDFLNDGEAPPRRTVITHPRIAGGSGAGGALRISVRRGHRSGHASPQMSAQIFDSGGFFTKPNAE